MHINKIKYDSTSKEITFAHMLMNTLYAVKETMILTLSSMIISTKFGGNIWEMAKPIATVHTPQNPTILGMPAWVRIYKFKNC
jgi:hypothetical protein